MSLTQMDFFIETQLYGTKTFCTLTDRVYMSLCVNIVVKNLTLHFTELISFYKLVLNINFLPLFFCV